MYAITRALLVSIIGLFVIIGFSCWSIEHSIDDLTDVLRQIKNKIKYGRD